ncbi:hypothetical protein V8C26DRAFT_399910 [Trichoderma gracile]
MLIDLVLFPLTLFHVDASAEERVFLAATTPSVSPPRLLSTSRWAVSRLGGACLASIGSVKVWVRCQICQPVRRRR